MKKYIGAVLAVILAFGITFSFASCKKEDVGESTEKGGENVTQSSAENSSADNKDNSIPSFNTTKKNNKNTTVPFGQTTGSVLTTGGASNEQTTLELTSVENEYATATPEEKDEMVNDFWGFDETDKSSESKVTFIEDLGKGFSIYEIKGKDEDGKKENVLLMIYFFKGNAYPVDGDSYENAAEREEVLNMIREDVKEYKKNIARVQTFSVMVWDNLYNYLLEGDYDVNDILDMFGDYY